MAMRRGDRVLILEKIDTKGDMGLFDPEVFKGKNNLHLVRDEHCYWRFKLERGLPPPPLRDKYTDFKTALKQAEQYFTLKNIRIVEIQD